MKKRHKFFWIIIGIIVVIGPLLLSVYLSNMFVQNEITDEINMYIYLNFNYPVDYSSNSRIERIGNIKLFSVEILYSKDYTRLIYSYEIINTAEKIKAGEDIFISEEKIMKNGFLHVSTGYSDSQYFSAKDIKVFSTALTDKYNDANKYIPLNVLEEQIDHCSTKDLCYNLKNMEIYENKFVIVLDFPSIYIKRSFPFNVYYNYIKSNYKRIKIQLYGNMADLVTGKTKYGVQISVPYNATFIYYTFPVSSVSHYNKSNLRILDMTSEGGSFYGEMEFYTSDTRLFISIVALIFAFLTLLINLIIKFIEISLRDDKKTSAKDLKDNNEKDNISIYPRTCE